MFTGHYAPAFALNRRFPEVALWKLFLGVQAVDILFWGLAVAGVERMHIDPTQKGPLVLVLEFMPFSHSLVAALGWAALCALALRSREGLVLAVAVASHWLCDLPMHLGDLPIASGDGLRVGFDLWSHPVAAWAFECGLVILSVLGAQKRLWKLAGILVAVQTLQSFLVPLPTSLPQVAAMSEASYLGFALLAWRFTGAGSTSR